MLPKKERNVTFKEITIRPYDKNNEQKYDEEKYSLQEACIEKLEDEFKKEFILLLNNFVKNDFTSFILSIQKSNPLSDNLHPNNTLLLFIKILRNQYIDKRLNGKTFSKNNFEKIIEKRNFFISHQKKFAKRLKILHAPSGFFKSNRSKTIKKANKNIIDDITDEKIKNDFSKIFSILLEADIKKMFSKELNIICYLPKEEANNDLLKKFDDIIQKYQNDYSSLNNVDIVSRKIAHDFSRVIKDFIRNYENNSKNCFKPFFHFFSFRATTIATKLDEVCHMLDKKQYGTQLRLA